jgi:peroxiredoxin
VGMTTLALLLAIPTWQTVDSSSAMIGGAAPPFSNVGGDGQSYSLASLKGKWIVLEWYNPSCPYTRQHYDSGAMPRRQRQWTSKGVIWLSISTTARIARAAAFARSKGGAATAVLDDLEAKTAVAYQAKSTPHMFVIDPKGVLIYKGLSTTGPRAARLPTVGTSWTKG